MILLLLLPPQPQALSPPPPYCYNSSTTAAASTAVVTATTTTTTVCAFMRVCTCVDVHCTYPRYRVITFTHHNPHAATHRNSAVSAAATTINVNNHHRHCRLFVRLFCVLDSLRLCVLFVSFLLFLKSFSSQGNITLLEESIPAKTDHSTQGFPIASRYSISSHG